MVIERKIEVKINIKNKLNNKMQVDLSQYINFTPEEFINGVVFNLCIQNSSKTKEISVLSQVKKEDTLYKLIIKGNYKRGSSVTIAIGNNESTTEGMYIIAIKCMDEYIPHFLFEDYPESLKKVMEDEAAKAAKDDAAKN